MTEVPIKKEEEAFVTTDMTCKQMTDFPTLRLCLKKFEEARTTLDVTNSQSIARQTTLDLATKHSSAPLASYAENKRRMETKIAPTEGSDGDYNLFGHLTVQCQTCA